MQVLPLGVHADLVIWTQRSAYRLEYAALRREVEQITDRLQRLHGESGGRNDEPSPTGSA